MNFDINKVKNFFRTPLGGLVGLLVIVLIAYLFFKQRQPAQVPTSVATTPTPAPSASVSQLNYGIADTPSAPAPAPQQENPSFPTHTDTPPPLSIDLFTSKEESVGSVFAPYGRLIRCSLVNTVDSSKIQTPIIGIVINDVLNPGGYGEVVVPAGTEVHGMAQVDRSRERIGTQNTWTLVWTDGSGREMPLTGIGCDMAKDASNDSWKITDGSAGLRGTIIKTDNWAEVKLFAATALEGVAQGLTNTQTSTNSAGGLTTTSVGSLQNGLTMGVQAVVQQYAQQVLERIRQDGFYVRVPAGINFYLYVTQTIDQAQAVIAGNKAGPMPKQSVQPQTQPYQH